MRMCGGCTECCTVLEVAAVCSPPHVECIHVKNGCGIYSTRPNQCIDWQCQWMADNQHSPHLMQDSERPDKVSLLVNIDSVERFGTVLVVHELKAGAVVDGGEIIERLAGHSTVLIREFKG